MKAFILEKQAKNIFIFSCACLITGLVIYTVFALRAEMFYTKVAFLKPPPARPLQAQHYRKIFSSLDQAIFFNPGNSLYHGKKADYHAEAYLLGLGKEFAVTASDIIFLYNKALSLNPTNFFYNHRLLTFYQQQGNINMIDQADKTINLCSVCYRVYIDLAGYDFGRGEELRGSFWLVKMASLRGLSYSYAYNPVIRLFHGQYSKTFNILSLYGASNSIARPYWRMLYTFYPNDKIFDFSKEGFPLEKVILDISVYTNVGLADIVIYDKFVPLARMDFFAEKNGSYIYRHQIKQWPSNANIGSLRIEMENFGVMNKIEIEIVPGSVS